MSVIILAGGKSSRMGKIDKQFLPFGKSETMLDYIVKKMKVITPNVIVVVRNVGRYDKLDCKVVEDIYKAGPLGGMHAGLLAADCEYSFIMACDMPFVNLKLVHYMFENSDGDVFIPRIKGNLEPLHAIYNQNCIKPIEEDIKKGEQKIINFFPRVDVQYLEGPTIERLDPGLQSFVNINTYGDYRQALRETNN